MVCSCFLCGNFSNPWQFKRFALSRVSTYKKRARPNTCHLDSPLNKAKNAQLKSPRSQNSIQNPTTKVTLSIQLPSQAIVSLQAKATWQFCFPDILTVQPWYTCQLSRLRRVSRARGLKTSISRPLTPAGQFLTPD